MDPKDKEQWKAWAAEQANRLVATHQEEAIRQNNLMYGGLIGVGIVMVQPFLTAGVETIDPPAKICVVAFSIAVPFLAALLVLNRHETYRRRLVHSFAVEAARVIALGSGFVGLVAGFWHILPIAGIAVLASGFVAMLVHSAGVTRLEVEHAKAVQEEDQAPET